MHEYKCEAIVFFNDTSITLQSQCQFYSATTLSGLLTLILQVRNMRKSLFEQLFFSEKGLISKTQRTTWLFISYILELKK